jgi:hypothetical protein
VSSGDWLRPDWLVNAMRAWTPSAMVPPAMAQAMRPVAELFGFAPAILGKELIEAAASHLVGQSVTISIGDEEVTLVPTRLQLERAPIGLMIGQLGDVELEADDVVIGGVHIAHLRLDARNLHVQPGVKEATVVAAPVVARAVLDQGLVAEAVSSRTRRVEVDLEGTGRARAYIAGRRGWGYVDVVPRISGRTLELAPADAKVRRWSLTSVARRLPKLRFGLSGAHSTAYITGVAVEDGRVVVDGVYPEWRLQVTPQQLDDLLRRINRYDGGVLRVPHAEPQDSDD